MNVEPIQFTEVLQSLRAGDMRAITEFVSKYEPFIRRTIRFRLARTALRPAADSVDVCQSVLGSFLIRLSAGEYELATEQDMRKLLNAIANKKFLALQRHELAAKRDRRQTVSLSCNEEIVDDLQASPEGALSQIELLTEFERRLDSRERELFDLRRQGLSWSSVADQVGEDAIVLRKRLSRAVKRVALELGIEERDG